MKRCNACREDFESKFSFCPIDGQVLHEVARPVSSEYRPTLIREDSLVQRLLVEARFVFESGRRAWPKFKANPIAFMLAQLRLFAAAVRRFTTQPYVMKSAVAAMAIIILTVGVLLFFDGRRSQATVGHDPEDDLIQTALLDFQNERDDNSKTGVGAGEQGRVGFDKGSGEG